MGDCQRTGGLRSGSVVRLRGLAVVLYYCSLDSPILSIGESSVNRRWEGRKGPYRGDAHLSDRQL